MKTNHSTQGRDQEKNRPARSTSSGEANSKMLKPDNDKKKKKSGNDEKFEGTLRHKEGETDQ